MNYRRFFYVCIINGFLLFIQSFAEDRPDISLEVNTKAVFIYHFTKYINWLDDDATKPFNIVILGEGEIYQPLKKIAEKKEVNQRKIAVKQISHIDSLKECHILFISSSEKKIISEIVNLTRNKNILTVSDTESYAKKGVAVNFVIRNDKVRFEINSTALSDLNLRVSSQLLKLAILVKGK